MTSLCTHEPSHACMHVPAQVVDVPSQVSSLCSNASFVLGGWPP